MILWEKQIRMSSGGERGGVSSNVINENSIEAFSSV